MKQPTNSIRLLSILLLGTLLTACGGGGSTTDTADTPPANSIPQAQPDASSILANEGVTINVLANDTGLDDGPITVSVRTQPNNGSVFIEADMSITYTPDPEFYGSDSFTYTITDIDRESALSNVEIDVACIVDCPGIVLTASWAVNSEPDITGYYLYHGISSGSYTKLWVGNTTGHTFYTSSKFFAVAAKNAAGIESTFSNEVSIDVL